MSTSKSNRKETPLWERFLQACAVGIWLAFFFLLGPVSTLILLYLLFCTRLFFLPILYAAWVFYDRAVATRGGRQSHSVRSWYLWQLYCQYFPISLKKTAELDLSKNYLFCGHPHGILCSGLFGNFATEGTKISKIFPGFKPHLVTLNCHFYMPGYRELCVRTGACAASKESISYLLSRPDGGHLVVLVVGGAEESLDCRPGNNSIILKKRKGFIKLALKTGASLVPVYSFGETDIYDQVYNPHGSFLREMQELLRKTISLAPALFSGHGLLPFRKPITTVVGAPIDVPKVEHPTREQIDTLHERYTSALVDLFETNKHKYIEDPFATLVIN